ncbi:ABC transporter permease [Clostridium arbusti]|uniref:ABC transporter permease n=1 Tax=Clostridium arbusti TaxID=1137848 RepID=UPI000288E728|nr:ABC transporter permease [Clostridium arbusti]
MIKSIKDVIGYIGEIYNSRQLLFNLTSKELKLKYRNSVLGFLWSFLNPILMLFVYTFAFKLIMRQATPNFTVFLLCGLLPWNFFAAGVMGSTTSIIGNANLIKKVYFPREIIPLSIIFSNFVNFVITLLILFVAVIVSGLHIGLPLVMLPVVLLLILGFTVGLSLILSSLNVLYRDISHLVEVIFNLWMYLTPVVYPLTLLNNHAVFKRLIMLNPMTLVVECMRSILYTDTFPYYLYILALIIIDFVLIFFGFRLFRKIEVVFAEEI